MVLDRSGWTMSNVVEQRPDSLTVLLMHWDLTTVPTSKMLVSDVRGLPPVPKGPSDFKEAPPLRDVWRSATEMSGEQYVMTSGVLLMPEWHADSLDFPQLV